MSPSVFVGGVGGWNAVRGKPILLYSRCQSQDERGRFLLERNHPQITQMSQVYGLCKPTM